MRNSLPAIGARMVLVATLATTASVPPSAGQTPAQGAPPAQPPTAAQDGAATTPPAPAAPAAAKPKRSEQARTPGPQPPDGRWLKDEDGREYFLEKLEKQEGTYRRLGGAQVRTRWGIDITVAKEDDSFFYYKVYRSEPPAPKPAVRPADDPVRIAETYRLETPESDHLRFVPYSQGLPTSGQWRNGFDLADINEDGHLDIVHGPARKGFGGPTVFLGDGKGGWTRWADLKVPRLAYDYGDAVTADFNGDGHLDFAVAGSKGDDGGGGFSSRALAVADWNGDKRPDLLALGEGPRLNLTGRGSPTRAEAYGVVVYLNKGDGSWERRDQGTGSVNVFGDAIDSADVNGDGRPDFAIGTNAMGRQDLLGVSRADGGWDQITLDLLRPRSFVRRIEVADLDGDGRQDLAVAYSSFEAATWRSGVDLLLNRSDGRWQRRALWVEESREGVFGLSSGDLDGDGRTDLVALTGDGRTWIFRGDGKGFFTREKTAVPAFPGGCRGYHAEIADLDGDGDGELVAEFAGESSALFAPDLCPSGGGITAWNVSRTAAPPADVKPTP
jgi:FG-GAP-like repeat